MSQTILVYGGNFCTEPVTVKGQGCLVDVAHMENSDKSQWILKDGLRPYKRRIIKLGVLWEIITVLVSGCQERRSKIIFNVNRNFCHPFEKKVLSSLVYSSHFKMNC